MSSAFHAVSHAVGGITGGLFGGGTSDNLQYGNMSKQDIATENDVSQKLQDIYAQQAPGYQGAAFQQHLNDFLSSGNPNPTQDQVAKATNFVDQTFTNPNQIALQQYNAAFGANQNAQAAALGRNPSSDIATQQAIYGEGLRQTAGLQAQRAALIANQAQNLNNTQYQRAAGQSQFLNGLQQQAFANQMGLLNGRTGLLQFNQSNRLKNYMNPTTTQPGLLGSLTGAVGGISSLGSAISGTAKTPGLMKSLRTIGALVGI